MGVKTAEFIWMDGKLVKWQDAGVHIMTHGLHYGTSVFEGIRSYKTPKGTAIFRLGDHIERLIYSANAMSMDIKFKKLQLEDAAKNLVKINKQGDAYIRALAYYGYGNVGVFPRDIGANVAIISVPWEKYYAGNVRIMTSVYRRHSEKSTVFGTKIGGNYSNSVLAMFEARKNGYDEALMLDYEGYVSEGPAENIFLVKNGRLTTPSSRSALHGITRSSIMEIANSLGIAAREGKVTMKDVKNADELFFCGTATEIVPVISVDGRKIGDGEIGRITSRLRNEFYSIVRGENKKYFGWLAFLG